MAEKSDQPPPYDYTPPPPGPFPTASFQQSAQPAQASYPPGQPLAQTVVIQPVTSLPTGPRPGSVGRYQQYPELIVCQYCNATVTTSTSYEVGMLTWAASGIICLVGCWLGCCFIPFCVNASKDVVHTCPNCQQLNGKFRHFS